MKIEINDNNVVKINDVVINEKVFNEEMVEYRVRLRTELIDDLINWISQTDRESDKGLMKDDLKYLMGISDEYCFSSISTNEYIFESDNEETFDEICEEILKVNKELENVRNK